MHQESADEYQRRAPGRRGDLHRRHGREWTLTDFGTDLDQASKLLLLNIQSPSLRKQIFQRLALKYLSDARQDTKNQIAQEIDAQTT